MSAQLTKTESEGARSMAPSVPRLFHFIWLGSESPAIDYRHTWTKHHPGWKVEQWSEDNLPPLINHILFERASEICPGHELQFKADLLRYELLYHYGGIYVDVDFECKRNIEELTKGHDCFAAWEEQSVWINNAFMGASVGHPLMHDLISGLPTQAARYGRSRYRPNVISGPQYLTRLVNEGKYGVKVFEKRLFYPYLYNELKRGEDVFPEAYAVHHWNNMRKLRGTRS